MVHPSCQSVRPDNETLDVVSTVPGTDTASARSVAWLNTLMRSLASKSSTVVDSPITSTEIAGCAIDQRVAIDQAFLYGESKTLRK